MSKPWIRQGATPPRRRRERERTRLANHATITEASNTTTLTAANPAPLPFTYPLTRPVIERASSHWRPTPAALAQSSTACSQPSHEDIV